MRKLIVSFISNFVTFICLKAGEFCTVMFNAIRELSPMAKAEAEHLFISAQKTVYSETAKKDKPDVSRNVSRDFQSLLRDLNSRHNCFC